MRVTLASILFLSCSLVYAQDEGRLPTAQEVLAQAETDELEAQDVGATEAGDGADDESLPMARELMSDFSIDLDAIDLDSFYETLAQRGDIRHL